MSASAKYVAAAHLVVFVSVLGCVLIMATRLQRLEREVAELVERLHVESRGSSSV